MQRLLLLLKSGIIGDIISVESTSTSLRNSFGGADSHMQKWGSITEWGPFAMLPVFMVLGCNYKEKIVQIALENNINKENLKLLTPKEILYEGGRELSLKSDTIMEEQYYVYGKDGLGFTILCDLR